MSLFGHQVRSRSPRPSQGAGNPHRIHATNAQVRTCRRVDLPYFLRHVNLQCRNPRHAPVAMGRIGDWGTNDGQPCAVYVCPVCGYREFLVQKQGQPFCTWYDPSIR